MTRIRYLPDTPNAKGISSKAILCGNDRYVIVITKETFNYTIFASNSEVVKHGVAKDMRSAKAIVKQALKELGGNFFDEVRRKKEVV